MTFSIWKWRHSLKKLSKQEPWLECYRGYNVEKRTELISLYFCPKKGKILWWLYDIFVQLLIVHGSFVAYPSTNAMGRINFRRRILIFLTLCYNGFVVMSIRCFWFDTMTLLSKMIAIITYLHKLEYSKVCSAENLTKRSSNKLLCLVRFSAEQMLARKSFSFPCVLLLVCI